MIDVDAVLAALTLEDRCELLAGATTWRTHAFPEAGLPALKMSDGPTGIRGEGHGSNGVPGVAVPSAITLGATWDPDLLAEIGDLLGTEAVRKRAHVLLGPTVNLHRTPLGGRTFECYGEDPELSGVLAASYVRAVQAHDVAVTVKHFVANDTEIERMRVDVRVDDATLREIYLRPFELAVRDGGAWGVMSAYNRVNGHFAAESRELLTGILRDEWGFDGFVVSDWFGAHHTVASAHAGLNIEMPAPARVYGDRLLAAVQRGEVTEATVEQLARDVVVLAARTRADERPVGDPEGSVDDPAERALTRRAAIAGTVLLRNEPVAALGGPVLPLDPARLGSVAVVGPNAVLDRSMGGGSASLTPFAHRTLLDAITERLASCDAAVGSTRTIEPTVTWEPGVRIDRLAPIVRRGQLRTPDSRPGLAATYVNGRDWDGPVAAATVISSSQLLFFGSTPDGVDPSGFCVRLDGAVVPEVDGPHDISVVSAGGVHMTVTTTDDDGVRTDRVVVDDPDAALPRTRDFFGNGSEEQAVTVDAVAGRPIEVRVRWRSISQLGFAAVRIGVRPPDPSDLLERAVTAAAAADTAIVVVGTNDEWETEGFDRDVMDLPGRQDELVRRVSVVNPNTVVVVNAGSPVTMDWAAAGLSASEGAPPAIVTSFFAGQEQAEAMVDVLLGVADPGGRLPVTYPVRLADTPAFLHHEPEADSTGAVTQRYGEGRFVGHRWYAARRLAPRFWFGHGLSYGDATLGAPTIRAEVPASEVPASEVPASEVPASEVPASEVPASEAPASEVEAGRTVVVEVPVEVRGDRSATVVAQAYAAEALAGGRPAPRRLAGWTKVVLEPGRHTVALELAAAAFQRWDTATHAWTIRPGTYLIDVGTSADPDAAHALTVELS
ncbi:MAG: glycoside hydrolase family 3 C-terminal domain-containing protein [Actinomycetota bacterium]